jgi:hypothetical protein
MILVMCLLHLSSMFQDCTSQIVPHKLCLTNCTSQIVPHKLYLTNCTSQIVPHKLYLTNCTSHIVPHKLYLTNCASQITYAFSAVHLSFLYRLLVVRTSAVADLPAATLLTFINNYCPYILEFRP